MGDSWFISFSGCPTGHSVVSRLGAQGTQGLTTRVDTLPRTRASQEPEWSPPGMIRKGDGLCARRSSSLWFQLLCVEWCSFLPNDQKEVVRYVIRRFTFQRYSQRATLEETLVSVRRQALIEN